MKKRKLLQKILRSQQNVRFSEVLILLEAFGFKLSRISASHHIFTHPEISENINLQNVNDQAKSYQIRQFLKLVERYNLRLEDEE